MSVKTSLSIGDRAGRLTTSAVPEPIKALVGMLGAAFYRLFWSGRLFTFRGVEYRYFNRGYKLTWLTERCVEVPIVLELLSAYRGKEVLEVGNVIQHYFPLEHDVVDKYEKAPGVVNRDVVDFDSGKRYDLIVSISTLEHVGFDEYSKEPLKVDKAMDNLLVLLAPGGKMVVTVPIGYNPEVDKLLQTKWPSIADIYYLRKTSWRNDWEEVDADSAFQAAAEGRFFWLNAIAILVANNRETEEKEAHGPLMSGVKSVCRGGPQWGLRIGRRSF